MDRCYCINPASTKIQGQVSFRSRSRSARFTADEWNWHCTPRTKVVNQSPERYGALPRPTSKSGYPAVERTGASGLRQRVFLAHWPLAPAAHRHR